MRPITYRLTALLIGIVAVAATPAPAGAAMDWGRANLARTYAACPSDGQFYDPTAQVVMQEFGKSGVIRMEATFRLYRSDVTAGFNRPVLEKTQTTTSFPNDSRSLYVHFQDGWTDVYATQDYYMAVRGRWDRGWRRDWTWQKPVLQCV